jgi:hypothetical protein
VWPHELPGVVGGRARRVARPASCRRCSPCRTRPRCLVQSGALGDQERVALWVSMRAIPSLRPTDRVGNCEDGGVAATTRIGADGSVAGGTCGRGREGRRNGGRRRCRRCRGPGVATLAVLRGCGDRRARRGRRWGAEAGEHADRLARVETEHIRARYDLKLWIGCPCQGAAYLPS